MNIERHISNLKQYIKDDEIIEKDGSDFANFCKGHIDDIQAVLDYIETMQKEFDRLEGIEDNTAMLKMELKEKEKVIDKMAEYISNLDIDEDICKNNITQPELCNEEGTNCRHCIKEYFYKRASEE